MKLRIKKHVLKEEYLFALEIDFKKYDCSVHLYGSNINYPAKVSQDFKKIILNSPLPLKGYGESIGGLAGYGESKIKEITELKLDRHNQIRTKEFVLGI